MKILLVRHGATAGNRQRKYIGRTDEPLSPSGIRQAKAAGTLYGFPFVYVTPLIRTRQTADLLFTGAKQIVLEDLREMDFGDFEGKSSAQMETDTAYRSWVEGGCLSPCPGGESREEFSRRVSSCFEAAVLSGIAEGLDRLVFVIHGGTIMAVLEKFSRPAVSYYDGHVDNCQGFLCTAAVSGEKDLPFFLTDLRKFLSLKEIREI